MINHYAITTELGRQHRDELAASFARSRRPRSDRRRWFDHSLRLRSSRTAPALAREPRAAI